MNRIPIYEYDCVDFSNNGLGLLSPLTCVVEEQANGMYELTMEMPIMSGTRFSDCVAGRIVKAVVPVRPDPGSGEETEDPAPVAETVTRRVYKVSTGGSRLNLRNKPSGTIIGAYAKGTEVIQLDAASGGWMRVQVIKGGATGYMSASYLTFVREYTEEGGSTLPPEAVEASISREQLFRIYSVENDTGEGLQTIHAMHIFYDLRGDLVNGDYKPENKSAKSVARAVFTKLLGAANTPFTLYCSGLSGSVTGDYGYLSPVEAWLEADTGVLSQCGGQLFRDNFNVYLLPEVVRDAGVTIRRGKNLIGVRQTTDDSGVITRIIPCGKNKDGDELFTSPKYFDSPLIGRYGVIRAAKKNYDVSVDSDGDYPTDAAARAALREKALEDFEKGVDRPAYGLEVDFVMLGSGMAKFSEYAALQAIHMFDTVHVIDEVIGIEESLMMTAYKWDVLTEQYQTITLGKLDGTYASSGTSLSSGSTVSHAAKNSVATESLVDLSVTTAKLAESAVTASKIADGAVSNDKLASSVQTSISTAASNASTAQSTADAAAGAVSALDTRVTALEGLEKRGSVSVSASSTGTLTGLGIVTEAGIYRISLTYQATTADAGSEYLFRYSGTGLSTFTRLLVIAEGAAARAPRLSSSGVLTLNSQAEAGTVRYRMNKIY